MLELKCSNGVVDSICNFVRYLYVAVKLYALRTNSKSLYSGFTPFGIIKYFLFALCCDCLS